MRKSVWFGYLGALGFISGCGDVAEPLASTLSETVSEATAPVQAPSASEPSHGCGDHVHDAALDTPEARAEASRAVSWRSPKKPGKSPTVRAKILGFNDFHGQLAEGRLVAGRPVGGAAVLASYLKAAQAGYEGKSLIIHAGDHVGASPPESALLQDEPAVQFLNALASSECRGPGKYDDAPRCNVVGTLGNHEFDEGTEELLRLINGGQHDNGPFIEDPYEGARFPYVSANVMVEGRKRDEHLILPYVIRKLDGVKVGVIGAVLEETPTIVTPAGVAGLRFLDEATAINEQVRVLKNKGVRTIVVSIHQGAPQSPTYTTPTAPEATVGAPISTIVSKLDDEVDVVVSGHAHAFTNALVQTASGHPILVTQAFSASTAYGDIELELDRASGDVLAKSARIVTTYSDQSPGNVRDPAVQALVDQAVTLTAPLVNRPVVTLAADVTRTQSPACESSLGNLIADAQRAAMGTDFAFMNPGGIRADLLYAASPTNPADSNGVALWGELFTIQPFGNTLVRLNMTGQQIFDLLNQQFAVNRFLQISGLTYTWDAALPAANRVVDVLRDGVPIDRVATYTVTANNFIATGGDGFSVFLDATGNVGGPIDLDAFIAYLAGQPQPVSSPLLGRITRLN